MSHRTEPVGDSQEELDESQIVYESPPRPRASPPRQSAAAGSAQHTVADDENQLDDAVAADSMRANDSGKKLKCCDQSRPGVPVLICRGPSHKKERLTHISCSGFNTFRATVSFLCDDCENVLPSSQSQARSSTPASHLSLDSQGRIVVAIHDERIDPVNGLRELFIEWEDVDGSKCAPSWEPEQCIDMDGPLYKRFVDEGGPVFDDDSQALNASQMPTNFDRDDDHEAARNPYWADLQAGYWAVLRKAWPLVQQHSAGEDIPTYEVFAQYGTENLAAMPDQVLRAICGSGLTKTKLANNALSRLLRRNMRKATGHPCIYLMEFVDDRGRSPTMQELRRLIDRARSYIRVTPSQDDNIWALLVDRVKEDLDKEESAARFTGTRSYLTTGKGGNLGKIEELLNKLETFLTSDSSQRLPFVLRDVGYTSNAENRITKQHLRHVSSNKIMNLFEAISLADTMLDGNYRMTADVVVVCFHPQHDPVGEILLSLPAQSYTSTGKGFNGVDAGNSINSLAKYTHIGQWDEWAGDEWEESPLQANMAAEMARIRAHRLATETLERDILELEFQLVDQEIDSLQRTIAAKAELERELQALGF